MLRPLVFATLLLGPASTWAQRAESPPAAPDAKEEPAKTSAPAAPASSTLTPDECVAIALGESGLVGEAEGKVAEWRGRLAEVQANYYPKLNGRAFVAPMFRVRGLNGGSDAADVVGALDVQRDYGEWGPYFHLEATLAQPIYTFGRLSAGKKAAEHRLKVEQARARQTRNALALEVRRFYFLHLYAKSMLPTLQSARKIVDGALEQAQKMYAEGTGKVTQIDLQKLQYGSAELDRYIVEAEMGMRLALEALKQTMGVPASTELALADEELPAIPEAPLPSYEQLLEIAKNHRPEWEQVEHGKIAAAQFEKSERRSSHPILFAAALLTVDRTAMRPDVRNPYLVDPYNGVGGGVAVGLQFDVDVAKTLAKGESAAGLVKQVEGLEKFASTGIPMEVRKAHSDAVQAKTIAELAHKASLAARKWMVFAGAAYTAGTGEAKDVLEGLVAYVQSRKNFYESLQKLHSALAYITYATGRSGLEERPKAVDVSAGGQR